MKRSCKRFAQDFSGESKTQQHFRDECDVNNIVAAFAQTHVDPHAERAQNQRFGFASSQTFSEAMQNIAQIRSAFADLPSSERSSFANDPARWIDSLTTVDEPDETIVDVEAPEEPVGDDKTAPDDPKPESD